MLVLSIHAPLLSLCITIISVVCELVFLSASLTFLRYRSCVQLRKSQGINIRALHRQALAITLFAMFTFVALETVTSIYSEPFTTAVDIQPCVRNVFGAISDEFPVQSASIHSACSRIFNTTVTRFEGNYSSVTGNISCSPQPIYSYVVEENATMPRENAQFSCAFRTCAFADFRNNTLLISGPQMETDQEIQFLPTRVNSNYTDKIDLKFIAESVAISFTKAISEVGETRRLALFGSVEGQCPFKRDIEASTATETEMLVGVVIAASVVWASSALFFFASLFFRRRIFFDITHPMHWARRARHDHTDAAGDDPKLHMVEVDGEICITVTGYVRNRDCKSLSTIRCDDNRQQKSKMNECILAPSSWEEASTDS